MESKHQIDKVSAAGLLIAFGIIYGDIGTSPLYVMQAIIGNEIISEEIIFGSLSCIIWTLTLQTTVKYVILILRADNRGEGGIFALFALVRKNARWLTVPAILGGSTLLADGIITPPISISSAVEGLEIIYPHIQIIPIVLTIITIIFLIQAFGTTVVGKAFGPVMVIWFSMLAILGVSQIMHHPEIFKAFNPLYGYTLLAEHPGGFWMLGAVFLCTTGAEALYSDLGHCGKDNIRVSWVMVKSALILNYLGQGAWLLTQTGTLLSGRKPFFEIMPDWWLLPGVGIATLAAVIASQALITGSFTLISEAIRLNFWPKVRLIYPSNQKGQLYVPSINWLLWLGCMAVVLYFKESANMEAAYGLAITLTMVMTTLLMSYYLYIKKVNIYLVILFLLLYLSIEGAFLGANLLKFSHGGWFTILMATIVASLMTVWLRAFYIKLRLTEYTKLENYLPAIHELSRDISIPKYATHLVFMTNASKPSEIETKIIYSIFQKRPKRADVYWFIHVDTTDDPYTMEYKVLSDEDTDDNIIKINFRLGFRVEQRINLFFRKVVEDMVLNKEVDITSRYESLNRQNITGDFRFVVLERFLSFENDLPFIEQLVMKTYFFVKDFTTPEDKWFGLDSSSVKIEKIPLIIRPVENIKLRRVYS
ncbi:KUP system potassium uptake protein [Dyadobacter jejuensis]|uniref:Probable potassium transport system protein Kup n=1 Tax=Dyadobacter jejuensis TaxID=1082580 RepID=A0A316AHI0_9BACT|nr:KUP/HAK/KT family potassium transporter [Dyadobacter jejuensis]PWJ57195.1 KUP system potassium uptake protein [Dyadobacter jejuensis]